ncbi:MAG: hypothetical protein QM500_12050 [Methylococcales bacterium]
MKLKAYLNNVSINAYLFAYNSYRRIGAIFMMALSVLLPKEVFAQTAQGLGAIGTNVAGQGTGLTQMFLIGFGVVGFAMVGIGLIKWKNAKQSGESMGGIIGMIVLGALLLSIPAIIGVMQATTFGTNNAQSTLDQIVQ